jgi:hypothetical protein
LIGDGAQTEGEWSRGKTDTKGGGKAHFDEFISGLEGLQDLPAQARPRAGEPVPIATGLDEVEDAVVDEPAIHDQQRAGREVLP